MHAAPDHCRRCGEPTDRRDEPGGGVACECEDAYRRDVVSRLVTDYGLPSDAAERAAVKNAGEIRLGSARGDTPALLALLIACD